MFNRNKGVTYLARLFQQFPCQNPNIVGWDIQVFHLRRYAGCVRRQFIWKQAIWKELLTNNLREENEDEN